MRLLIAGIDPGTTVGYALVDFSGKLVSVGSAKELSLGSVISRLLPHGKVVAVGSDKQKVPGFVSSVAAKLCAKTISPAEDLPVQLKRDLTLGKNIRNTHEMDAVAIAMFALGELKPLLDRIHKLLERYNKLHLFLPVVEIMLKNDMISTQAAVALLEQPRAAPLVKRVIEQRQLTEQDFLLLYDELGTLKQDSIELKNFIKKLQQDLVRKPAEKVVKKIDADTRRMVAQRDSAIEHLKRQLAQKEQTIQSQQKSLHMYHHFLMDSRDKLLVKKLLNLGSQEYGRKKQILRISEGDILLVEDPSIISDSVIAVLKDLVSVIICRKKPSQKLRDSLPLLFIDAAALSLEETDLFAFARKSQIQEHLNHHELLHKIIRDYKKSRES